MSHDHTAAPAGAETETLEPGSIAQRPRLVSRLRLLPLAGLCLAVTAAATVGIVHGGEVTLAAPARHHKDPAAKAARQAANQAARDQARAAKAKSTCTPKYDTGVKSEPWQGARRRASEKIFAKQTKKDKHYVQGKDGYYFFNDDNNDDFSQALGRETQSPKEQAAWAKLIKKEQQIVQKAGGHYYVVVAPAKWDIYPKKLPAWAQKLRGTTSLRALMKAHPELPFIDPSAALAKAARSHDTYEKLNSHWTPYGGWVAWQMITKCLRATDSTWNGIDAPAITGVTLGNNLNEFGSFGVPDGTPQRTFPVLAAPHPATTQTHLPDGAVQAAFPDFATDMLQMPVKTVTPGAQRPDLTMLTLRDSTGNAPSPFYSTSFGTTIQYGHGIAQVGITPPNLSDLMATYHPNLVLFVITERFLGEKAPK
jgi:hypothetical protein